MSYIHIYKSIFFQLYVTYDIRLQLTRIIVNVIVFISDNINKKELKTFYIQSKVNIFPFKFSIYKIKNYKYVISSSVYYFSLFLEASESAFILIYIFISLYK